MYKISKDEIKNMNRIGSGVFGSTYLKDNKVFKVYHEKIKAYNDFLGITSVIKNPCLRYSKFKYDYLKKKNAKLKYTGLIDDVLYIDGMFSGVVMPYYDGNPFKEYKRDSIERKISMIKQLVRNAKELTDNGIYPLDYNSSNILLSNNKVQIIDLDDKLTKIINPLYTDTSIKALDEAIKSFIGDIDYNNYTNMDKEYIKSFITKPKEETNDSYTKIKKYLEKIIKKNNYIIINGGTNIDKNLEMLRNPNYRIIYMYDSGDNVEKDIINLRRKKINIYTIIPKKNLVDFLSSVAYEDLLTVSEKKLVKIR